MNAQRLSESAQIDLGCRRFYNELCDGAVDECLRRSEASSPVEQVGMVLVHSQRHPSEGMAVGESA